jgi:hypothetical protein
MNGLQDYSVLISFFSEKDANLTWLNAAIELGFWVAITQP